MTHHWLSGYHEPVPAHNICNACLFLVSFFLPINTTAQSGTAANSSRSFIDVPYKEIQPDSSLVLDIFLPENNPPSGFPALMIIHGGGWAIGDKSHEDIYYMQRLKSELLRYNLAVISINYRLVSKEIHLPDPVTDCKDAIRWARAQGNTYNIDTSKIGLWGGSAGGHLALLAAYSDDADFIGDKDLAHYSSRVDYVIDNFGLTDLHDLFRVDIGWLGTLIFKTFYNKLYQIREQLVFAMTGYPLKKNKAIVTEICEIHSPINFVGKQTVPTIIFHSTKDNVVPIAQSERLKAALDHSSIPNEFIIVPGGDHGFNTVSREVIDDLIDQSIAFIKKHQP